MIFSVPAVHALFSCSMSFEVVQLSLFPFCFVAWPTSVSCLKKPTFHVETLNGKSCFSFCYCYNFIYICIVIINYKVITISNRLCSFLAGRIPNESHIKISYVQR